MKSFSKKCLISFLMILVVSNFMMGIPGIHFNTVYAADGGWNWDDILGGIVGVLFWPLKLPFIVIPMGINTITSTLYQLGLVAGTGGAAPSGFFVTPYHILFNKMEIVNVNFFNLNSGHTTADAFRAAVASWYYTVRVIASMILLVILVYVGIRMAISTIASEKAMYKKMLVDWVTSLALLFLLHYIIQFTFACNEALVNGMDQLATETNMDTFVEQLVAMSFGIDLIASVTGIAVYAMLVLQTLSFLIAYMKRMITVGFLIIIAPLITITYSMDKMGDGKAQALNNWLKEFIYNVLIQPFHCILYLAFGKIVLELIESNGTSDIGLATAVLAILCIQFIKDGEKIVKKIFGFDQASSMGAIGDSMKTATAAMGIGTKIGAAAGVAVGKSIDKTARKIGQENKKISAARQAKQAQKQEKLNSLKEKRDKNGKEALTNKENRQLKRADNKEKRQEKRATRKEDSMREKARQKEAKAEEKIFQQMKKNLGEAGLEKLVKGQDTPEGKKAFEAAHAQAAQDIQDKKEKRQKIGGVAGKVAGGIGKGVWKVASAPTRNVLNKDSWKVIAGISTGMIGLGDDFGTAVNAYQVGSGFTEGLMKTSTKKVRNNIDEQIDLQNNVGNNVDARHIAMVKSKGDGDGYSNKELGKKLEQLLDKLNELKVNNAQGAVEDLNYGLTFNPQSINQDTISAMLDNAGVSDENKEAAMSAMMGFAQFRADAGLYQAMEAGNSAGLDMNYVLEAASIKSMTSSSNTTRTETHETETTTEVRETVETDSTDLENIKRTAENAEEIARQAAEDVGSIDVEKMVIDNNYQDW